MLFKVWLYRVWPCSYRCSGVYAVQLRRTSGSAAVLYGWSCVTVVALHAECPKCSSVNRYRWDHGANVLSKSELFCTLRMIHPSHPSQTLKRRRSFFSLKLVRMEPRSRPILVSRYTLYQHRLRPPAQLARGINK